MVEEEIDIPLKEEEKKEKIEFLKKHKLQTLRFTLTTTEIVISNME